MRRVRCPKCSNVIEAATDLVTCSRCGLSGNIGGGKGADPWTITIDLRNLRPKNWSPATRASMMFILLVGVFFAGGLSGVVFERTRETVAGDLEGTAGILGAGDQAASGPGDVGTSSGTIADTSSSSSGETTSSSGATSSSGTTSSSSGDTSSSTSSGSMSPPPSGDTEKIVTLTGPGKKTFGPVPVQAGLYRLDIEYFDSTHAFEMSVMMGGSTVARIGSPQNWGNYEATRYIGLQGGHVDIFIGPRTGSWDGDYSITVYKVGSENGVSGSDSRAGKGDAGIGPIHLDGTFQLGFSTSDKMYGQIVVTAYLANGTLVDGCRIQEQVAGSSPYDGTVACALAGAETVYIDVAAPEPSPSSASGWRLDVN